MNARILKNFPMLVAQEGPLKGQRWPVNRPMVHGAGGHLRGGHCRPAGVAFSRTAHTDRPKGSSWRTWAARTVHITTGMPSTGPVMLQDGDAVQISFVQEFLFFTSDATVPLAEGMGRPGRLAMEQKSRRVWVNQQQLVPPLSAQQFKLLWLLYENQGQVHHPDGSCQCGVGRRTGRGRFRPGSGCFDPPAARPAERAGSPASVH